MVIFPELWPFPIVNVLLETVYSLDSTAVPEVSNTIVISFSETKEDVAVKTKSVAEFSTILGALNLKLTTGAASLSTIFTVEVMMPELNALTTAEELIRIVSSSSSFLSSIGVIVALPLN